MHILGASGHAKVIVDTIKLNNQKISGIWDDNLELEYFLGYKLKGRIASLSGKDQESCIVAIGNNSFRKEVALGVCLPFENIIHPSSYISPSVIMGKGVVVMANATINCFSQIGNHVIINTNSSVDHDCIIEDFVHVSPQAGIAGNVFVCEGAHIGIGASLIQGIKIGKWATVGAGTVVIRDVPDFAVVVGNPGKILRYNKI